MPAVNLSTTFAKAQTLLNTKGYRFTRIDEHDLRGQMFWEPGMPLRAYHAAAGDAYPLTSPGSFKDRGVGWVVLPGEQMIAYLFLYDGAVDYYKKLPTPLTEPLEVVLTGGHVKWTNTLLKELRFLEHVENQSGLQPFDPKDAPAAVYKAVK